MFEIRPSVGKVFAVWSVLFIVSISMMAGIRNNCLRQDISLDVCFEGVNGLIAFTWVPIFISVFFLYPLWRLVQKNHCRSCGSVVPTKEIEKTLKRKITAFSESTQAVTSLNPVLGVGSGGQGASIGIGAMQSTSHIPVKLASYISTVKCPECGDEYSWINNGKVRIWTSVEGVETVEDLEEVFYPFKMVK